MKVWHVMVTDWRDEEYLDEYHNETEAVAEYNRLADCDYKRVALYADGELLTENTWVDDD